MFALDRFSDYKANLDDILHVGNASDAAPDSFAAQENFLSQLEIEVGRIIFGIQTTVVLLCFRVGIFC